MWRFDGARFFLSFEGKNSAKWNCPPEHGEKKKAFYSAYPADGFFQMDFFAGAANLLKINAGVQS